MKSVKGDLGLMELRDLLAWGKAKKKSGSLKVGNERNVKTFYLQEGQIVFLTSNKEGERIGEFLSHSGTLELPRVKEAILESQRLGIPFTRYLLKEKILDQKSLANIVGRLVVTALAEAMTWVRGSFEFTDVLPPAIVNGPIKLDAADIFDRASALVEKSQSEKPDQYSELLREIAQRLAKGEVDLPPMPDTLVRLNECMSATNPEVHDILKILISDQILTSKILKVANSAYYSLPVPVASLQHAVVYIGFRNMLNIVTAHTLNQVLVQDTEELRGILRHSLMCAYLCRKIGADIGFDEEDAFVCGLLHDIGKTTLVNLLADFDLPREVREQVIRKYHPQTGSLLAIKWNFPERVRNAVRFHHEPELAPADHQGVEIVWLANRMLHDPLQADTFADGIPHLDAKRIDFEQLYAEMGNIEEAARAII